MISRIVIVGGGFAGLKAAQALGEVKEVSITVIDRKNHHLFQPLLYQVATAALNPSDIGVPIRMILANQANTKVHMESVTSIDLAGKIVKTDSDIHPFDYLILACGASHSYFGRDEWQDLAPGLKTIEDALEIRRRILLAFEQAEKENDPVIQGKLLTFVIIGGGPTGVELAGSVAELANSILSKEFRNIQSNQPKVILIQGGERLIPSFAAKLSENAKRVLEKKGVEVVLNFHVDRITPEGVWLGERFIATNTIMWAAGVKASPLSYGLGVPQDKEGRIIVSADLSLPGHPNVFVLGDQAHFAVSGMALPGLAPVAMQQGVAAGENIIRDLAGKPRLDFIYRNKGTMAVIGRGHAVVELPFGHTIMAHFTGFLGWFIWILVHILTLVGFRNRALVLVNWAWSYFTFKRGARLITQPTWKVVESKPVVKEI
jgi:NADH:ubiquinone reductase (H+-translocating)